MCTAQRRSESSCAKWVEGEERVRSFHSLPVRRVLRSSSAKQGTLDGVVSVIPAAAKRPLVGKDGIREFVFEMIVDADLVRLQLYFMILMAHCCIIQPFRFIDRPSFRRLLLYVQPKLADGDIPKHTTMANMVLDKIARLDEMDIKEFEVSYVYICPSRDAHFETSVYHPSYLASGMAGRKSIVGGLLHSRHTTSVHRQTIRMTGSSKPNCSRSRPPMGDTRARLLVKSCWRLLGSSG